MWENADYISAKHGAGRKHTKTSKHIIDYVIQAILDNAQYENNSQMLTKIILRQSKNEMTIAAQKAFKYFGITFK